MSDDIFGECSFSDFKRYASEFFKLAKECSNRQEIDNGFKALLILYFSMNSSDQEEYEASIIIDLAGKI